MAPHFSTSSFSPAVAALSQAVSKTAVGKARLAAQLPEPLAQEINQARAPGASTRKNFDDAKNP